MLKKLQNLANVKVLDQETMMNLRGGQGSAFFACGPITRCMLDSFGNCFCCPTGWKPCDEFWPQLSCVPKDSFCE